MTPEELKARTKRFALDVIALVNKLPRTLVAEIIARQLVRAATSVGANYFKTQESSAEAQCTFS